jgi:uncharacterized membrane protein
MARKHGGLRHEHVRVWIALAISLPTAFVVIFALALISGRHVSLLTCAFLSWDIFGTTYVWLTLRVFNGTSSDELRSLVADQRVPSWYRKVTGGADGPGTSVQFSVIALAAAAMLPRLDSLARDPDETVLLTALIVIAVIMSLVVVTLTYAVHYARIDVDEKGLSFPGDDEPGFLDYLYLSAALATTFGTTDVTVTSRRMRRAVIGHSVITFTFNTVVIALLVSALSG